MLNSSVTATDVRNAISIHGPSLAALKGKTRRMTSTAARQQIVGPRVTQVQQTLDLDIFFVKQIPFLIGVLSPLGLNLCQHIKNRSFECVDYSVRTFLSIVASRDFAVKRCVSTVKGLWPSWFLLFRLPVSNQHCWTRRARGAGGGHD